MRKIIFLSQFISCNLFAYTIQESPLKPSRRTEAPWINPTGNSQQTFPLFPVQSVNALVFEGEKVSDNNKFEIPGKLKPLAIQQRDNIVKSLATSKVYKALLKDRKEEFKDTLPTFEFMIWPAMGEGGHISWVFAQYRLSEKTKKQLKNPGSFFLLFDWAWLNEETAWKTRWHKKGSKKGARVTTEQPLLPLKLEPFKDEDDRHIIFSDFLDYSDNLYQQPYFGDCVWVEEESGKIIEAWLDPGESPSDPKGRKKFDNKLIAPGIVAYGLARPPYISANKQVVIVFDGSWEKSDKSLYEIRWKAAPPQEISAEESKLYVTDWNPKDLKQVGSYEERFKKDVFTFAGTKSEFKKKGSFQEDHDLEKMVDYLTKRYDELGIKTYRHKFKWRGIKQSNLIAFLPGRKTGANQPKVILADHIDTACEEDTFDKSNGKNRRMTSPGASDNVTATATLLRAAEVLRTLSKKGAYEHDILLVHLTGEEFPSDGLGTWRLMSDLFQDNLDLYGKRQKIKIKSAIIPDFIGFHKAGENIFQINPNDVKGSVDIARLALDASRKLLRDDEGHLKWKAKYQPRDNPRNGVFNTDIAEFEFFGIPGLLFNEYLDYSNDPRKDDPHNHQSTDTPENIKFDFASDVSKVVIETTVRASDLL